MSNDYFFDPTNNPAFDQGLQALQNIDPAAASAVQFDLSLAVNTPLDQSSQAAQNIDPAAASTVHIDSSLAANPPWDQSLEARQSIDPAAAGITLFDPSLALTSIPQFDQALQALLNAPAANAVSAPPLDASFFVQSTMDPTATAAIDAIADAVFAPPLATGVEAQQENFDVGADQVADVSGHGLDALLAGYASLDFTPVLAPADDVAPSLQSSRDAAHAPLALNFAVGQDAVQPERWRDPPDAASADGTRENRSEREPRAPLMIAAEKDFAGANPSVSDDAAVPSRQVGDEQTQNGTGAQDPPLGGAFGDWLYEEAAKNFSDAKEVLSALDADAKLRFEALPEFPREIARGAAEAYAQGMKEDALSAAGLVAGLANPFAIYTAAADLLEKPFVGPSVFMDRLSKGDSATDAAAQGMEAFVKEMPFQQAAADLDRGVKASSEGDIAGATEAALLLARHMTKEIASAALIAEGGEGVARGNAAVEAGAVDQSNWYTFRSAEAFEQACKDLESHVVDLESQLETFRFAKDPDGVIRGSIHFKDGVGGATAMIDGEQKFAFAFTSETAYELAQKGHIRLPEGARLAGPPMFDEAGRLLESQHVERAALQGLRSLGAEGGVVDSSAKACPPCAYQWDVRGSFKNWAHRNMADYGFSNKTK